MKKRRLFYLCSVVAIVTTALFMNCSESAFKSAVDDTGKTATTTIAPTTTTSTSTSTSTSIATSTSTTTTTTTVVDPASMVDVPGGSFSFQNSSNVTLSPFKMGKCEVTYGLWNEVKNWATTSGGYTFANAGQMG